MLFPVLGQLPRGFENLDCEPAAIRRFSHFDKHLYLRHERLLEMGGNRSARPYLKVEETVLATLNPDHIKRLLAFKPKGTSGGVSCFCAAILQGYSMLRQAVR